MTTLHPFELDYLRLVLEIHAHHIEGFVDAYYGPTDVKTVIDRGKAWKPAELVGAVEDLRTRIPTDDPARHAYLTALLRGLDCTTRMINGETFDYLDEVHRIYDIRPELIDETRFAAAHRELDLVLPHEDGNNLAGRLQAWRKRFEINAEAALPLLELARAETRRRTTAIVDLPDDESVELALVKGQPWGAYNWYLGNGRSLIEFNTDIPLQATGLLGTFAHEGYPGHHTEHLLKERRLYRERGYAEQAAMLLHSPSAVIAEGIATTALEMIFPDGEHHEWNAMVLLPAAGIPTDGDTAESLRRVADAAEALRYVSGNAAILYHTGRMNREQTLDYIQTHGLVSAERAAKSFSFLSHPLFRSYVFTYSAGYDLIAATDDPAGTFRRLLTEQILPSAIQTQGTQA
jgi:hypothetical protein